MPESTATTANTSNARMVRRISAVCRLGLSSGSVTRQNLAQAPAPNTSAASLYSFGIRPMPETRITNTMAVARHTSATTTASRVVPMLA